MVTCYAYKEEFKYCVRIFTRKNSTKVKAELIALGHSIAYSQSLSEKHQIAFASDDREIIKQTIKEHFFNKESELGQYVWKRIESIQEFNRKFNRKNK